MAARFPYWNEPALMPVDHLPDMGNVDVLIKQILDATPVKHDEAYFEAEVAAFQRTLADINAL